MTTKDSLLEIGLSEKEAMLYLASLKLGAASVLSLSRETKIHRTIVYKLLEDLIEKGVFKITLLGKRKLYIAIQPKQLLGYIKLKETVLRDSIPELEALSNIGTKRAKVLYYEGREQLQELFRTGLRSNLKEMRSFFPSKYMIQLFGKKDMEKIIQGRIKNSIRVKTLRSSQTEEDFEGSKLTKEALREVRYIPEARVFEMGIVIFDNKVNLFSPIEENFGLQIESDAYSKLMRYFFDSVWAMGKKAS